MKVSKVLVGLSLAIVGVSAASSPAQAQWAYQFYRVNVAMSASHGVGTPCCSGLQTGWVNATLNGNNRPTLSAAGAAYNGDNQIALNSGDELPWYAVGTGVEADGSGFNLFGTASFNTGAGWYAAGQPNNTTWQRSAHLTGIAANSGTSSWTLNGDDDAWLFVNGALKVDNGGVKAFGASTTTTTSVTWAVGDKIEIFFADRHVVQSQLAFTAAGLELTRGDPNVSVPEPSTYALMATGLVGLFGLARRRRMS